MKSKYGAKKINIDGITFDSKNEGRYYLYLKELKAKGKILNFELQPKFTIIPTFVYKGKKIRAATYTLDFLICHLDGRKTYIDIKGFSTQQGDLKFKLLKSLYPELDFKWISRSLKYSPTGWIEYEELKKIRAKNKKEKKKQLEKEKRE